MQLRPYQAGAIDDLWSWFSSNPEGNPIVEASVGAGKSVMIARTCQRAIVEYPGTRMLVIVHQKELLDQNVEKIIRVWPEVDIGIYSASHGRKQLDRTVTYATIGSIYKRAYDIGRVDIVLADECHLINPKDTGMWRHFLSELKRTCPHVRVVGWTGTPFRGNGVWLTAGEDALFTHIAARVTMRQLLDDGYLSPLVPAPTAARIDTDGVRTSGEDFVVSELAKRADTPELVDATCNEIVSLAAARRRWLVFAVTVEHAQHVADALRHRGVSAEIVSGETPKTERDRLIADFKAGRIRCLINVAVLTTGFDVPEVDFIALLRATKSPVLYVQIAGRGMRLADGKENCMWADFTDTTERLGAVDQIKGRMPHTGGSGEAPFKLCPNCGTRCATGLTSCPTCGFEFPPPERIKHTDKASAAAIMSGQETPFKRVEIDDVEYRVHTKFGSPDSVRVDYKAGIMTVASEWVCPSHEGFARRKFERWWMDRRLIDAIPGSTEEMLEWLAYDKRILRQPVALLLQKNGKYHEIVSHHWEQQKEAA